MNGNYQKILKLRVKKIIQVKILKLIDLEKVANQNNDSLILIS